MKFLFLTGMVILTTVCETAYSFPGRRDSQLLNLFSTQPSPTPDDAANEFNSDNVDNRNLLYLPSNGISQPPEEHDLPEISFLGKISKTEFPQNNPKTSLNLAFNAQLQPVNQDLWRFKKYRVLNKTQFHPRNQKSHGSRNNPSYQKHRLSTTYMTTGSSDRQQLHKFPNRRQVHTFQSLGTNYPSDVASQSTSDSEANRHFQNRVNSLGNSQKGKQGNQVFGLHDKTLVSNQQSVVSNSYQSRDKYSDTAYQRHQNPLIRKGQEQSKNLSYNFVLEQGNNKSTLLSMPQKSLNFDAPTLVSKSFTKFLDKKNSSVSVLGNSVGFKDYHNLQTKEPENDNRHPFIRFDHLRFHADRPAIILDKLTDPLEPLEKNKGQAVDLYVNNNNNNNNNNNKVTNMDERDQNPQMDSLSEPGIILGNVRSVLLPLQPDDVIPKRKTEALIYDLETYTAFNQPTLSVENNVQRNNETWESKYELNLNRTSEYQHQGTKVNAADDQNITVPTYTKSLVFHTNTLNNVFGDIGISSQRPRNGNKVNEAVNPNEGGDQEHDIKENRLAFSINEHHVQGQENKEIQTDVQRNSKFATLQSYDSFPIGNELSNYALNLARNVKGAASEVTDGFDIEQSALPSEQSYNHLDHFQPIDTAGTTLQSYATQSQDDNRERALSGSPVTDSGLDLTSYHTNPTEFQYPRFTQNSQSNLLMGGSDKRKLTTFTEEQNPLHYPRKESLSIPNLSQNSAGFARDQKKVYTKELLNRQSLYHGVIPQQNYDTTQKQDYMERRKEAIQSDSFIENETEYMTPPETDSAGIPEQSFDDHNVISELPHRNYHNYLDIPTVEKPRKRHARNVFDQFPTTQASRETQIINIDSQEPFTQDNFFNSQDQYLQQNSGNENTFDNYQVSDNAREIPSNQYYTQHNVNENIYEPFNNQGTGNVLNSDNDNELLEYNSSFESNEYNLHMPATWDITEDPNQENVLWNMPATWNLGQASGNDFVDERNNGNTEQRGEEGQDTISAAGMIDVPDVSDDENENNYDYDLNEPPNAGHYNSVNSEQTREATYQVTEPPTQEYQWYSGTD